MRQQIHEDSALMNGIKVFMGELSQAFSYLHFCLLPCENARLLSFRGCKAHETARYIISRTLTFPISQTVRIKFLSFISYSACGILI